VEIVYESLTEKGMVKLSDEAREYFDKREGKVDLLPAPGALGLWSRA
jgi:hypothetical protein